MSDHPFSNKNIITYKNLFLVMLVALTLILLPATSFATTAQATSKPHVHVFFHRGNSPTTAANNLNYNGGPVMPGQTNVYAIFWEPTINVQSGYNSLIIRYFRDIGSSPLYRIAYQYTQANGSFPSTTVLAGSWVDGRSYPESPLLDSDIQSEVTRAQQINGWSSSNNNIFFVFLERNQNLCLDSSQTRCASNYLCAYHSYFGRNTIYAAMPYAASFSCSTGHSPNNNDADQTINVTSHEQMEAATDPFLNAWYDGYGNEIGDKCAWNFGSINQYGGDVTWNGHTYIIQQEWSNNTSSCSLVPSYPMAQTAALTSWTSSLDNLQHIAFIGQNGHVYEWYMKEGQQPWAYDDVTTTSGAPVASSGSLLTSWTSSLDNLQHIAFIGQNAHVYELYMKEGQQPWAYDDVTTTSGAPIALASALTSWTSSLDNLQHIAFIGQNAHVYELYMKEGQQPWAYDDVTATSGAPIAWSGSLLTSWTSSLDNLQHIACIGQDRYMYELYMKEGQQPWTYW